MFAWKIVFLLAMLSLVGCAKPTLNAENGPITASDNGTTTNIVCLSHQSLGVQSTPALQRGEGTAFEGQLSDQIMGEEYPGRIRRNGWAVNEKDDREFFVQFVRVGIYRTGESMYYFLVDGKRTDLTPDTKVVELSSFGEFVSNLSDKTYPIERDEFKKKTYRLETVRKYGSRIGTRREVFGFVERVRKWNVYDFEQEGKIYSPYGAEDIRRIKRINPGYTPLEKMIANGHATISTDPVVTVASIALTVIEGMNAPSTGWDYSSQLPSRAVMGAIIAYSGQTRLALISELNAEIDKLNADIGKLKKERGEAPKNKGRKP